MSVLDTGYYTKQDSEEFREGTVLQEMQTVLTKHTTTTWAH